MLFDVAKRSNICCKENLKCGPAMFGRLARVLAWIELQTLTHKGHKYLPLKMYPLHYAAFNPTGSLTYTVPLSHTCMFYPCRLCLLDFCNIVLESKNDEEIENFELISHTFGVRNISNQIEMLSKYLEIEKQFFSGRSDGQT